MFYKLSFNVHTFKARYSYFLKICLHTELLENDYDDALLTF